MPARRFRCMPMPCWPKWPKRALGHSVKVALIGPLTFLWLGKSRDSERIALLDTLIPHYVSLLAQLKDAGAAWIQLDEPILGLDLPPAWRNAFEPCYWHLAQAGAKLMLATYFSPLEENLSLACRLPVAGLHVDGVRARQELVSVCDWLPLPKVLSVGIVDGRNIWRTDLDAAVSVLAPLLERREGKLWLAPSCSLLHVPFSLEGETGLDPELRSWMAFAAEKLDELSALRRALTGDDGALAASRAAIASRARSTRVHCDQVANSLQQLAPDADRRQSPFARRQAVQRALLQLPDFPTTTIGSFPQTPTIRTARAAFKRGAITRRNMKTQCAPKSRTPWRARKRWGSTCWCTARPNATTWSNTSASSSTALPSRALAGCSRMARAASSRPSFSATWPGRAP